MVKVPVPKRAPAGSTRGPVRTGVPDARFKLIAQNRSQIRDARDRLASLAQGQDARKKLEKIRNLKAGKLEEKRTRNGAVTITQTLRGQTVLTTQRKARELAQKTQKKPVRAGPAAPAAGGAIKRRVGRGGAIRLSTQTGETPRPTAPVRRGARTTAPAPARVRPLTRTIRGEMSQAAQLDAELLNTHVDPVVLKRTIKQSMRRSSPPSSRPRYEPLDMDYDRVERRRERSRSPMAMMYYDQPRETRYAPLHPPRRRYNDYDDPRAAQPREDDVYRRRMLKNEDRYERSPRTMGDRLDTGVSPLQGAKIVVSNLQASVSPEDILELFGDIGPLKRSKIIESGTAEVVFVNRSDAIKAVEIYHNRQLDGKAMKCHLVGSSDSHSTGSTYRPPPLPPVSRMESVLRHAQSGGDFPRPVPQPEINAIHRALFADRLDSVTTTMSSRLHHQPTTRSSRR
eukprot:maker-scaffold676_size113663-snap-gene-0.27 protein:Tk06488 transcript:maker-scaffold676_size113663-snap-gene-0.27-mRNA-1 annotation:"polymerase delta-interacting protein 3"